MADLRAVFEAEGYDSVQTYIQSGNVVFTTNARRNSLEQTIENALATRLSTPVKVVVRSPRCRCATASTQCGPEPASSTSPDSPNIERRAV